MTGFIVAARLAGQTKAAAKLPAHPFPSTAAHLIEARTLIDYVQLADEAGNNVYTKAGDPTTVVWGMPGDPSSWIIRARNDSFLTAILKRTYPTWATEAFFTKHFGQPSPHAHQYHQAWSKEQVPHFRMVTRVADLQPGDLIAINTGTDTGHICIVRAHKGIYTGNMTFADQTQHVVEVVDCTAEPHGVYGLNDYDAFPDTRMPADGVEKHGGGRGHMIFYANNTTGQFSAHRWSVNTGPSGTYNTTQRPITAVRVQP